MKDLKNRSEFEDGWQKAFLDAEMSPSDDVWTRIDAKLANQEAGRYRKKAFYYKMAAAASIALALAAGLWAIRQNPGVAPIVQPESAQVSPQSRQPLLPGSADEPGIAYSENLPPSRSDAGDGSSGSIAGYTDNDEALAPVNENMIDRPGSDRNQAFAAAPPAGLPKAQKMGLPALSVDLSPKDQHINRTVDLARLFKSEEKAETSNNFWAGLSFAGGRFNPDFSSTRQPAVKNADMANFYTPSPLGRYNGWYNSLYDNVALANEFKDPAFLTPSIQDSKPEVSYSVGVNFGGRLGLKWAFQSGLYYAKNITSSSTSAIFIDNAENRAYPVHVANFQDQENAYTLNYLSSVSLNNNFEFISIPLKAGYILFDERIGLTVFSGVSSDIFIRNQVDDGAGGLETVKVTAGDGSPFRSVWLNGLFSIELKYNPAGRYSAFVEPSYKVSLNSLTKPGNLYESYPTAFSIGAGIKLDLP